MNAPLLAIGLVVCVITLVITGIKMAQKGGERRGGDRERAERLAENAKRKARAEAAASRPVVTGSELHRVAERYRRRRLLLLGEDPEGCGSAESVPSVDRGSE